MCDEMNTCEREDKYDQFYKKTEELRRDNNSIHITKLRRYSAKDFSTVAMISLMKKNKSGKYVDFRAVNLLQILKKALFKKLTNRGSVWIKMKPPKMLGVCWVYYQKAHRRLRSYLFYRVAKRFRQIEF